MICDYEIFPELHLVFMRLRGVCTFTQLKAAVERLWQDRRFSHSYNGLIDLTDTNVGISRTDFQALMEFVLGQKSIPQGRWAAVASSPLVTAFGMLYQRLAAERHPFRMCSTFQGAREFVGVDFDEGSPLIAPEPDRK